MPDADRSIDASLHPTNTIHAQKKKITKAHKIEIADAVE
jgi:hypothetical protein